MSKGTFNQKVISATGVGTAALLIIIAGNAGPLVDGLKGLPALIAAMSNNLPLGSGSFVLALVLGPLFHLFLSKWLPESKINVHRKSFFAETLTLLTCSGICLVQQWGGTAPKMLLAGALGAVAGFMSPYIVKGFQSILRSDDNGAEPKSD